MSDSGPRIIKGVCHFFSEQGMEGGVWALQDERFIFPNTTNFRCTKCEKRWDTRERPAGPEPGPTKIALYSCDEQGNFRGWREESIPPCENDAHDFKPSPPTWWSYGGLHFLEDGDHLTIFDKDDPKKIVWEGTIDLEPTNTLYTPRAYQRGVEKIVWERWFMLKNYVGLLKKIR